MKLLGYTQKQTPSAGPARRELAIQSLLFLVTLGGVLTLFVPGSGLLGGSRGLRLGDRVRQLIIAPRDITYIDSAATKERQAAARAAVRPIYKPREPHAVERDLAKIQVLEQAFSDSQGEISVARAAELLPLLPSEAALRLAQASPAERRQVFSMARQVVAKVSSQDIPEDTVKIAGARLQAMSFALSLHGSPRVKELAAAVGSAAIGHNQDFDARKTELARMRAERLVRPVRLSLKRGDVIAQPGERLGPQAADQMAALGIVAQPELVTQTLGRALLAAITLVICAIFLRRFESQLSRDSSTAAILCVIVIAASATTRASGVALGLSFTPEQQGYIAVMCVAAAAMAVVLLMNARLGAMMGVTLAIVCGMLTNSDPAVIIGSMIVASVGILAADQIRDRASLVRAGLALGLAGAAVNLIAGLLRPEPTAGYLAAVAWGVGGGLISIIFVSLGVSVLERWFSITTDLWLLELANPNHPLLRRLHNEATGTYIHSINVGNLAEAAAEAVGAGTLKSRVGAYYHDIGKLKRPHFFTENQLQANEHENLQPSLSALIVIRHVRDGLELARDYKLPPFIHDVISQHHGTSLVTYFYAQQLDGGSRSDGSLEHRFRYDGPKPSSAETSIIMLADVVEAAARSLPKPSLNSIEQLVSRLVAEKIEDGQLDNCPLTYGDLDQIKRSFVHTLMGQLHSRVEYPELEERIDTPDRNLREADAPSAAQVSEGTAFLRLGS